MPRNIEIKCRVGSLEYAHRKAREISGREAELIRQDDIFFHNGRGRLKLRVLSEDQGQLIFYDRPDQPGPKLSAYSIYPTENPAELGALLELALGTRGRVRKKRWLYLAGSTRIHLDEVETLGNFIELEVVLEEGQDLDSARRTAYRLMEELGVRERDLVEKAYIDLLEV